MKKKKQMKKLKPETEEKEITKQQFNIQNNLYKYRFLNTKHIQTFLKHKSKSYVIDWLNDLTERKYIRRYYTKKMKLAGIPAIYSLGLQGRKYLKRLREKKGHKEFRLKELDRVYQEKDTSMAFKIGRMNLAEIHLSLLELVKITKAKLYFYSKVELKGMKGLIYPEPDAYFAIEELDKSIKRFFLEYFDLYKVQDDLEKRVRKYITFFKNETWQDNTGHPFPEVIMIYPNNSIKGLMNQFIKDKLGEETFVHINFYLSTRDEIKRFGIKRTTLHKVK